LIPAWAEDFSRRLKGLVFFREEDRVLIIPPNQVYSLNETAVKLMKHIFDGGGLREIEMKGGERVASDVTNFLRDLKTMIEGKFEETAVVATEFEGYKKNFYTYPVLSEFSITWRCNLDCRFCYRTWKESPELSTREAKRVIWKIKNEAKLPFISFTGGEPLLRKDLERLIKYARSIGLKVNLISNGTLITASKAGALARAGLGSAQISLESPSERIHDSLTGKSGSWKATVEGIRHLLDRDIYVHTNTTINRENMESMLEYPEFIKSIGIKKFSANIIIPVGEALKHRELWLRYTEIGEFIDKLKRKAAEAGVEFIWYSPLPHCIYNPVAKGLGGKSCAACHGLLSVDPEGNVLPCSSYPLKVGNMLKQGFERVWFSSDALHFREMEYLPETCRHCQFREACAGACPLYWKAWGTEEIEND